MTKCSIDWSDLSRVEAGFATTVSPREVRSKVHSEPLRSCASVVLLLVFYMQIWRILKCLSSLDLPWQLLQGVSRWIYETTTLQKRNKKPLSLLFFCNKATTTCATVDHSSFCASEDRQICFEENRSTEPDVRVFIVASDSAE
jgi:hypothetical protein